MKKLVLFLFATFLITYTYSQKTDVKPTVYYLIRHAEKDITNPNERDPNLTKTGLSRAKKWSEVLKYVHFDAVYSTNFIRTKLTASPTAKANNIEITIYDPNTVNIKTFKTKNKSKTVLIVGHSNSTPSFVNNLLDKSKYEKIDESVYGNLYIVTIINGKATSQFLQIN